MPRRLDFRRISKHRNYTVAEIASLLGVSRGTVRRWIKHSLHALTDQKPMLVLGEALIDFLKSRRKKRQTCSLSECYCFSCRAPRTAAGDVAELRWVSLTVGDLRARCTVCKTVMHKRIAAARLGELRTILDVAIVQDSKPISDSRSPCLNDHFDTEHANHG